MGWTRLVDLSWWARLEEGGRWRRQQRLDWIHLATNRANVSDSRLSCDTNSASIRAR